MTLLGNSVDSPEKGVIILGAGEVGFNIAERLARDGRQVVLVDRNRKRLQAVQTQLDVQTLYGSVVSPAVLNQAGLERAEAVIAVTNSDEVNLLACLIANSGNPAPVKLARIRNDELASLREIMGPDLLNLRAVINPDAEVVKSIETMIALPRAVDYGEFGEGRIKILAVEILAGPLIGKTLAHFPDVTPDRGLRVGGILRRERLMIPQAGEIFQAGDVVYFVCLEESMATVLAITGTETPPVRYITIVGGGDIGLRLAEGLDKRDLRIKLIDSNEKRCVFLAGRLSNAAVLVGDGTDRRFMLGENIGGSDMTIALTGDEETNILICLLAKSLGCPNTITRVNKNAYMPIVRAIGLRLSVNPRLAASNSVIRFLRRGLRLSSLATQDENVEMLEGALRDGSELLDKPIRNLAFPAGINLLAVVRGDEAFIPRGDTILKAGDCLTLLCDRTRLAWVGSSLLGRK
ncbi:MAG: Trk system potassium transporter TrkA [Planctomycetota bacterium]|nr:Trk system potassium transporter TrkA [Planctomycetota bacterium]